MEYSEEELCRILQRMEVYGGSFVVSLANLYHKASFINKRRIILAFEEYFDEYHNFKKKNNE